MTLKKVKKEGVSIHAFFSCNSVKLNLVAKKSKKRGPKILRVRSMRGLLLPRYLKSFFLIILAEYIVVLN